MDDCFDYEVGIFTAGGDVANFEADFRSQGVAKTTIGNYLKSITQTEQYDIKIPYEDICSYLRNQQGHDEQFNDHSYGDDSRVALFPCFSVLAATRLTVWPGACSAYPYQLQEKTRDSL